MFPHPGDCFDKKKVHSPCDEKLNKKKTLDGCLNSQLKMLTEI